MGLFCYMVNLGQNILLGLWFFQQQSYSTGMKLNISNPFWHVTGLGTLAGMRTFSAPVIVSHILSGHKTECLEKSPLRFMQSSTVASVLKVMALAELVADKLPATPNRIDTGGVVGRFL